MILFQKSFAKFRGYNTYLWVAVFGRNQSVVQ